MKDETYDVKLIFDKEQQSNTHLVEITFNGGGAAFIKFAYKLDGIVYEVVYDKKYNMCSLHKLPAVSNTFNLPTRSITLIGKSAIDTIFYMLYLLCRGYRISNNEIVFNLNSDYIVEV